MQTRGRGGPSNVGENFASSLTPTKRQNTNKQHKVDQLKLKLNYSKNSVNYPT